MMGQVDPYKLSQLAQEWDPTPFLQATQGAGGAMDMFGSAASPTSGVQPQQGMDFASILGMQPQGGAPSAPAPGMGPLPPQMMQQFMQPPPAGHPAPAAAPKQAGMINLQSPALPRAAQPVPTLAQLLSGRG